jgi:hypothetical protein
LDGKENNGPNGILSYKIIGIKDTKRKIFQYRIQSKIKLKKNINKIKILVLFYKGKVLLGKEAVELIRNPGFKSSVEKEISIPIQYANINKIVKELESIKLILK